MGKRIKAIVFDLDDTLYEYKSLNEKAELQVKEYCMDIYHLEEHEFRNSYYKAKEIVKSQLRGTGAEHNRILYFQVFLELIKQMPASCALELYEIYWDVILNGMFLRDGVEEIVNLCHKYGIIIGICSDLTAMIQHRKLRKLGLEKKIDFIVTSEEAGVEKPNLAIFKLLLSKMKCEASECIFVGDSWERDFCGARNAGMIPVWFSSTNNKKEDILQISNFYQLRQIVMEHI
jgi:HAD hydrolase, family IA, variant 1